MIPVDEYVEALRGKSSEMAFVYLEARYRALLRDNLREDDNSNSFDANVLEYMNHTLAAAKALDLTFLDEWSLPSHKRSGLFNEYKDFVAAVDNFNVQVQIANARGTLRYSVRLQPDENARELIDSIARLLGRSKEIEDSVPRLPSPPKRIPPPKDLVPSDDEIPF